MADFDKEDGSDGYFAANEHRTYGTQKIVSMPLTKSINNENDKAESCCAVLKRCCHSIYQFYFSGNTIYVLSLLSYNSLLRMLKFSPALLLTYIMEVINGAVININSDWLQQHFMLIVFIPVISAIAGNIGLQTSSSISSYINVVKGEGNDVNFFPIARKYMVHNLLNCILMACIMAVTAWIWDGTICKHQHAVIILIGSFFNMFIASLMGIVTPFLSDRFGYDPSAVAGPFETAIQDLIGFVFFIYFSAAVINNWKSPCMVGDCISLCDQEDLSCLIEICQGEFECYKKHCH